MIVQMIPFVLLHIGKPEIEVLSTIVTGIYSGYIAYRGNSLFTRLSTYHWCILLIFYSLNATLQLWIVDNNT